VGVAECGAILLPEAKIADIILFWHATFVESPMASTGADSGTMSGDDDHLLIGRALGQTWRRENKTESYVSVPPALIITDSDGGTWTFGTEFNAHGEINVLRNDIDTGEFAERIEYLKGVVRLYGKSGLRSFSRSRRHFI
jgi:hypothetical protein